MRNWNDGLFDDEYDFLTGGLPSRISGCHKKGGGQTVQAQPVQQSTTSEPWAPQQPFLEQTFEEAQRLYEGDAPSFYPGATYTELAPQSDLALNLMENRALMGSPVQDMGRQEYMNTLGS